MTKNRVYIGQALWVLKKKIRNTVTDCFKAFKLSSAPF